MVGRFLGFVRPLLPFIAGAARWQLRRFLRYDIFAAGLWATTFSVLGYVFWHSFDKLTTYVSRGLFALGTVVALVVGVVALVQLRRDAAKRAAVRDWLEQRSGKPAGGSSRASRPRCGAPSGGPPGRSPTARGA